MYKNGITNIISLLDHKDEDDPRFETKEWYIVNDHNNGNYRQGDGVQSTVKFNTEFVKPCLCDYSDAYILVTGDIKVAAADDNTRVAIKNCHQFTRAFFKLNDEQIDTAENLDLTMNLYNMLEYSDNYADTTGSLYQYKRLEQNKGNNDALENLIVADSSSFKCQSRLFQKQLTTRNSVTVAANIDPNFNASHKVWKNIKITVPLKYISNFFKLLELPLINTKLYMELNWTKYSVLSSINQHSIFQITKGELYIPVVTLNTENNKKSSRLLSERFERTVVWNEYKSKIERISIPANDNSFRRTTLDTSFRGVNKLLAAAYKTNHIARNSDNNSKTRYYLPRAEIKDYNVLGDGRNFYDQNVTSSIVRYNELLKMTTGRSEDYSTGCLLDYDHYLKEFNITAIDLSHQAVLHSDPKVNQQIEFVYKLPSGAAAINCDLLTVLEKEKQTVLKFSEGTVKVY